jgi:ribonuclease G
VYAIDFDRQVNLMQRIVVQCENGLVRAALLHGEQLVEYYAERQVNKPLVGNVYKGRVVNVLPGMQAAFVQIGLEKNAFLYIDDVLPAHLEKVPKVKPSISEVLKEGQELLVQVAKEPIGTKGARVTTHISIPGRWLVYMPNADYIAVSRKIESETERERLKRIGEELRDGEEGMIVRTVAEEVSKQALKNDLAALREIWFQIMKHSINAPVPTELFRELDMVERLVRDIMTEQVTELVINDPIRADKVRSIVKDIDESWAERVVVSPGSALMKRYGIDDKLEKALRSKIWLDSGGYIIIDRTEALTVIDVNTGKFTGSIDLEETVFRTNLEAAEDIARLLRLRDIGGIIIIDFIDMSEESHRDEVLARLAEALKKDRTKAQVVGWTKLGLVEITRKKVREDLDEVFFENCSACGGSGRLHSRLHPAYGNGWRKS